MRAVASLRRTIAPNRFARRALVRLDRANDAGRGVHWDTLAATLLEAGCDHVSVDIFDTVLMRPVVGRENEIWLVGAALVERGLWSGPVEEYVRARRAVEARLPLAPLARLVQELTDDAGRVEAAVAAERDVERAGVTAVPGAAEALQRLRDAGRSITFLTDMHLDPDILGAMLRGAGLSRPEDHLLVSTEVGASKAAGTLFTHLPPAHHPIHVGNDLWGDVAMAQAAGVDAIAIRSAEPTRLESVMAQRTGGVGTAIAGAARRARLTCRRGARADDGLAALGADVAGQCLTAFLLWVRDECERDGIDVLAFQARDGELPLRMARAMPADHWTGATLTYLEGNRTAWSLAAAHVQGIDEWLRAGAVPGGALHQLRHVLPLQALLRRVGLAQSELPAASPLRTLDPTAPLPVEQGPQWEALLESEHARDLIARAAAERHGLVVEHLRAVHPTGGPLALIDVGWSGRLAGQLSALFRDAVGVDPLHLHVGGSKTVEQPQARIRRFALDDAVEPLPFAEVVACVETFTQTGKPRNTGFERDADGTARLVFDGGTPEVDNEARRFVHEVAVETARALPSRAVIERWRLRPDVLDDEVRSILTSLWTRPEVEQARAVAALRFETDDAGALVGPIAAPYRLGELLGRGGGVPRQWREGSLAITAPPVRALVLAALGLRSRLSG